MRRQSTVTLLDPDNVIEQEEEEEYDDGRPPFVLDGWWSDRTSQVHAEGLQGGFVRRADLGLAGAAVYREEAAVPLLPPGRTAVGEHVVHVAMLDRPGVMASLAGARAAARPRFKLMGLMSC